MRHISMEYLMKLSPEQLQDLLWQADRELFQAQLTRDWLDTAVQFRLWSDSQNEIAIMEAENVSKINHD